MKGKPHEAPPAHIPINLHRRVGRCCLPRDVERVTVTKSTEETAVEAIAGIIVRDVLQEEYDDLVEGYLDEILTASRRIMQLPAYAAVGKLFEKRLDDAITSRDARIEKLEAALEKIAAEHDGGYIDGLDYAAGYIDGLDYAAEIARQALYRSKTND